MCLPLNLITRIQHPGPKVEGRGCLVQAALIDFYMCPHMCKNQRNVNIFSKRRSCTIHNSTFPYWVIKSKSGPHFRLSRQYFASDLNMTMIELDGKCPTEWWEWEGMLAAITPHLCPLSGIQSHYRREQGHKSLSPDITEKCNSSQEIIEE